MVRVKGTDRARRLSLRHQQGCILAVLPMREVSKDMRITQRFGTLAAVLVGSGSLALGAQTAATTATVKGEAQSEQSPGPRPVDALQLAKLREWFNASSGSVRLISLLSPT